MAQTKLRRRRRTKIVATLGPASSNVAGGAWGGCSAAGRTCSG